MSLLGYVNNGLNQSLNGIVTITDGNGTTISDGQITSKIMNVDTFSATNLSSNNLTVLATLTLPNGSILDVYLTSNVPLKNTANIFSQLQTLNNGLTITSGTITLPNGSISDVYLTSNVPLKNTTNTFLQLQTLNSGITVLGTINLPNNSISDSALSSNIPKKDATNTFTQLQTLNNGLTITAGTINLPNNSISDSALSSNIPKKDATNTFTQLQTLNNGVELRSSSLIRFYDSTNTKSTFIDQFNYSTEISNESYDPAGNQNISFYLRNDNTGTPYQKVSIGKDTTTFNNNIVCGGNFTTQTGYTTLRGGTNALNNVTHLPWVGDGNNYITGNTILRDGNVTIDQNLQVSGNITQTGSGGNTFKGSIFNGWLVMKNTNRIVFEDTDTPTTSSSILQYQGTCYFDNTKSNGYIAFRTTDVQANPELQIRFVIYYDAIMCQWGTPLRIYNVSNSNFFDIKQNLYNTEITNWAGANLNPSNNGQAILFRTINNTGGLTTNMTIQYDKVTMGQNLQVDGNLTFPNTIATKITYYTGYYTDIYQSTIIGLRNVVPSNGTHIFKVGDNDEVKIDSTYTTINNNLLQFGTNCIEQLGTGTNTFKTSTFNENVTFNKNITLKNGATPNLTPTASQLGCFYDELLGANSGVYAVPRDTSALGLGGTYTTSFASIFLVAGTYMLSLSCLATCGSNSIQLMGMIQSGSFRIVEQASFAPANSYASLSINYIFKHTVVAGVTLDAYIAYRGSASTTTILNGNKSTFQAIRIA